MLLDFNLNLIVKLRSTLIQILNHISYFISPRSPDRGLPRLNNQTNMAHLHSEGA